MATFDIAVSAGSAKGEGASAQTGTVGTLPSDFVGSIIQSVTLVGTPTITSDGSSDDTIGVRFWIQTDTPSNIYGSSTSDISSLCYGVLGADATSDNLTLGSLTSPKPTIASAIWSSGFVYYAINYTASMKNDGETLSWATFTIRVTYLPTDLKQVHYRWSEDVTGGAHESWPLVGTEDTSYEVVKYDTANHALIVKLANDGGDNSSSLQLQRRVDGGSWADVNASSTYVRSGATGDVDGASSLIERLTTSSRTYYISILEEVDGAISLTTNYNRESEVYFGLQFQTGDISGGEEIEFRIQVSGETVTESVVPTCTIPSAAGETATGAPSVYLPTASGTAQITKTATGSPSTALPTSSGTAKVIKKATGAVATALITAAGVASTFTAHTADGAPSVFLPTASGTAEVINTSAGSPDIAIPTTSGTATVSRSATGAPTITLPTASGAAEVVKTATGAPSAFLPTAAGTAQITKTATGAPSVFLPTAAGTAEVANTATGAPSVFLPTASGTAQITRTATGSPSIALLTSAGTADADASPGETATGAPSVFLPTAAGTAEVVKTATGAPSAFLPTAAGTAQITKTATGSPSITLPTAAGAAEVANTATGSPSVFLPTASGTAEVAKTATGSPSITLPTAAGTAEVANTATGSPSVFLPTAAGTAQITKTATGSPSITLLTSSGTASMERSATGSPSIALITSSGNASAEGVVLANGAPSITLPTASGTTALERSATGSPSIALATAAGTAQITKTATGSPSITLPTASGTAEVANTAAGSPSVFLPTASGAAQITKTATGAPSVFLPTAAGTAEIANTATGSPSVFLPTAAGTAGVTRSATGAPSVFLPTASGTAGVDRSATGSPSIALPTSSGAAVMEHSATGAVSITLPTAAGTGVTAGSFVVVVPHLELRLATLRGLNFFGYPPSVSVSKSATGAPSIALLTANGSASVEGVYTATGSPSITLPTAAGVAETVLPDTAIEVPESELNFVTRRGLKLLGYPPLVNPSYRADIAAATLTFNGQLVYNSPTVFPLATTLALVGKIPQYNSAPAVSILVAEAPLTFTGQSVDRGRGLLLTGYAPDTLFTTPQTPRAQLTLVTYTPTVGNTSLPPIVVPHAERGLTGNNLAWIVAPTVLSSSLILEFPTMLVTNSSPTFLPPRCNLHLYGSTQHDDIVVTPPAFRPGAVVTFDDFNRTELGSKWINGAPTSYIGEYRLIRNDVLVPEAGEYPSPFILHTDPLPNNQYIEFEVEKLEGIGYGTFPYMQIRGSYTGPLTTSGYWCYVSSYQGDNGLPRLTEFSMGRWDPGLSYPELDDPGTKRASFGIRQGFPLKPGTKVGMEAVGEHIAGYIDYGEGREYIVWGRDQTYPTGVGGIGSDTQLTPDNRFAVEQYDTAQEAFTSYEAGEMERLLVLTSHAPTVSVSGNHLIKPEAERLYFASEAPIFFPEGVASPAVATLSLTGQIPRVSMLITVPVRPLILAGWWPIAVERTSYTIEVDEATLTLAGEAPGAVDLGANITVPEATLQLTGVVPIADLTHSGEASEATLLLTGKAPLIAQSISFFPPVATLVLEADAPTFYIKRVKHRAGGRKRLISFTITRRLEHLKD